MDFDFTYESKALLPEQIKYKSIKDDMLSGELDGMDAFYKLLGLGFRPDKASEHIDIWKI